jgi:hypothetical protein
MCYLNILGNSEVATIFEALNKVLSAKADLSFAKFEMTQASDARSIAVWSAAMDSAIQGLDEAELLLRILTRRAETTNTWKTWLQSEVAV